MSLLQMRPCTEEADLFGARRKCKRKRTDGYSEADIAFIVEQVQQADQEQKPIPWEWIGSKLSRTTGAVKKQYQRIKSKAERAHVRI
jgi:hypothetical protein